VTYKDVVSAHRRRSLAKSLQGVVRSLDPRLLPGASPLNRAGLGPYVPEIRALAARVGDLKRPASRRGLQLVRNLLTDGGSPLYDRDRVDELPETVRTILHALEAREGAGRPDGVRERRRLRSSGG
jgi:hypothetical protein